MSPVDAQGPHEASIKKKRPPRGRPFVLSVSDRNQAMAQAIMRRPATPATSSSTRLITTRPQRLMVGMTSGRPAQATVKSSAVVPRAGVVQLTSAVNDETSVGVHWNAADSVPPAGIV